VEAYVENTLFLRWSFINKLDNLKVVLNPHGEKIAVAANGLTNRTGTKEILANIANFSAATM